MKITEEKIGVLCRSLKKQSITKDLPITGITYQEWGYKENNQPPAAGYFPFPEGTRLEGVDKHFWFRMELDTPKAGPEERVFLTVVTGREGEWDATNPQGLVYLNGEMAQGLDVNHTEILLKADTRYTVDIYFYTGMKGGKMDFLPSLHVVDQRIAAAYWDFQVPLSALKHLDPAGQDYAEVIRAMDEASNLTAMRKPYSEEYYHSLQAARELLDRAFYHGVCGRSNQVVDCIGHTHIDVAWLWTLAQTKEKAQRSFATALALMDEYPEYRFMASQPQLYQFVKEEAPDLYDKIKERIREGRWEVDGAMWLEADCNLTSGESLVRQILHGKRFMMEEFGVDSKILWLPDVFGYSAALPQILQKSGVEYFVTSKISWNDTNKMPYDSFQWEGIDGSRVFTKFLTTQELPDDGVPVNYVNYNGDITPGWIKGTYQRYQQKEYCNRALDAFGYGDGGGGPTRGMLERQRRMAFGLPGYPKTEMHSVLEHLDLCRESFEENAEKLRRTPTWTGELYLEYHRGTYTSMAKNKRNNRKTEFLLQKTEGLSVAAALLWGQAYPQKELDSLWKTALKNQFHDIIPGSSIFEVYEESAREYEGIQAKAGSLKEERLFCLAREVEAAQGFLVYNALGFPRRGTVSVQGKTLETGEIPAFGWKVVSFDKPEQKVSVSSHRLENWAYRLELDGCGNISSLFDKRFSREVFRQGEPGNQLQLFEDFPKDYDAWDIPAYYQEKPIVWMPQAQIEPVFDGDRIGLRITREYQASVIVQTVYLYNTLERIDFETEIHWHEEHHLLKAAFPFDIHTAKATYEIQFGNLERPTYANTSWDTAKFEVCGHKWADLSEGDYGVSVLNDCKYGWSVQGGTLKLTLLKCATDPNPHADKGKHVFTYSLLPHGGGYRQGNTVREAYSLNQPLECRPVAAQKGNLPSEYSLVACENPNLVLETVKQAEDGKGIILRLYDAHNCKAEGVIQCGFDFQKAYLCDLMENQLTELETHGRTIKLPVGNFEIITIKLMGALG